MSENCKDCAYVSNLRRDVEDLKENIKDIDKRVGDIEIGAGESRQQMKTVFNMLKTIGDDVNDIKRSKNKFFAGIVSGVTITVIAAIILQAIKIFHW